MRTFKSISHGLALAAALVVAACAGMGEPTDIPFDMPAPKMPVVKTAVAQQSTTSGVPIQQNVIPSDTPLPKVMHFVIHTYNQTWQDWMTATDKLAISYITSEQSALNSKEAVEAANQVCRIKTRINRPNKVVAVLSNMTLYALTQFPFAVLGAHAFAGAKVVQFGLNGASNSAGSALGNGIVQLGGQVYDFENCAIGVFQAASLAGYDYKIVIIQKSPW